MASDYIPRVLLIALLILLSAYFSSSETAFTSANRIRLRTEAEKGDQRAARALRIAEDYSNVLSTILVGNNVVNIASSAIATVLFVSLFPTYGTTVSTIVMTIVVLIFAEITPKAIAKQSPEAIAKLFAPSLGFLMRLLKPVNWLFDKWNTFVTNRFGSDGERGITEDELLSIVDEAESDGQLDNHELIRSAIEFSDIAVKDILTPRIDVVGADWRASEEEIQHIFDTHEYSRILLYEEQIDHVIGILHERDFNRYLRLEEKDKTNVLLEDFCQEALFVPSTTTLPRLLKIMQLRKNHLAVVNDEYGGTMGIVTLEDILEELVGEIWDETDKVEEELIQLSDGGYMAKGNVSLEKIFQLFNLDGADRFASNTVSGFLTECMGRFPEEGDAVTFEDLAMDVIEVVGTRVEEVHIYRDVSQEAEEDTEN